MDAWVPFFQSLIWPTVIVVTGWLMRVRLERLVSAVEERIVEGAEFEAGGIKFGPAPKLSETDQSASALKDAEARALSTPADFYLVHQARRDRSLDRQELKYWRIKIYLDADDEQKLRG